MSPALSPVIKGQLELVDFGAFAQESGLDCMFPAGIREEPVKALVDLSKGYRDAVELADQRIGFLAKAFGGDLGTIKQDPRVVVITCSDSRVLARTRLNQSVGKVFMVRNAGAVLGPISRASLEFAITHYNVPLIIGLAHTDCGAMQLTLDNRSRVEFLGRGDRALVGRIRRNVPADLWANPGERNINIAMSSMVRELEYLFHPGDPDVQVWGRSISDLVKRTEALEDDPCVNKSEALAEIRHGLRALLADKPDSPLTSDIRRRVDEGALMVIPAVYDLSNHRISVGPPLGTKLSVRQHSTVVPI